jgi:prevent-host-death family protein
MRSVGIRELRERTSEIIRWVREEGAEVLVTHYGRPVARLVPVVSEPAAVRSAAGGESAKDGAAAVWAELDQLAAEIGARWPGGISATEAVAEGRREL